MTIEESKKLRERYKSLLGYKKEMLIFIKRKEELEQTPEVMEYFKLCDIITSGEGYSFYGVEKLTDEQILSKVLNDFHSEEDNNIYTCLGIDLEENLYAFKNIETFVTCNIKEEDLDEFESNNIVMYPKHYNPEEFFNKMREEYYMSVINNYSDRRGIEHTIRRSHLFNRNRYLNK